MLFAQFKNLNDKKYYPIAKIFMLERILHTFVILVKVFE